MTNETSVAIVKTRSSVYPRIAPFHPSERFPEYQFGDISSERNDVYAGFRNLLASLRLDEKQFDTKSWNPLGELITLATRS
jgi:hypothetical protein